VSNSELSSALAEYAALLELAGANSFAARAFRRAAEFIGTTRIDVAELVRTGRIRDLRGIGPGIEARLRELVETGRIAALEELRKSVSPELAAFGRMHGFTAKRFVEIGSALGIQTVDELRQAAQAGRLQEVPGIGPHREQAILAALSEPRPVTRRPLRIDRARALTAHIAEALGGAAAGDPRRWRDRNERLAVVVASTDTAAIRARFAALPEIVAMIDESCGIAADGTPVELVVTSRAAFGTAMLRATGPAEYIAELEPLPDAADETAVYAALGMPYIPPELRELPLRAVPGVLVDDPAIRGDLHCHSTWSDGKASVAEMARAAQGLGYDYLAICDHTTNVRVVPGLDAGGVERQAVEIEAANVELAPFRVLRGIECDILPDGSLDLPDDILASLDWVQISLHAGQRAPRRELTARVVEAMNHPAARCLSHPTGRIIGHRPENALDLERTIEAALETGVALEVNGLPDRLDLRGELVATAIDAGVRIVCSSDAHSTRGLRNMTYAVHTARRGGASTANVVNAGDLREVARAGRRVLTP
jgi:DNA polymerase (family 10)